MESSTAHTIMDYKNIKAFDFVLLVSMNGTVVRPLAWPLCGPGLIPGLSVICGLSLLLLLVPALTVFLRLLRFSPLLKSQHF